MIRAVSRVTKGLTLPNAARLQAAIHPSLRSARPAVLAHASTAGGGGNGGGGPRGYGSSGGGDSGGFRGGRHSNMALVWGSAACLQMIMGAEAAQAKKDEPQKNDPSIEEMAGNLTSLAGPVLANLGFSGVIGVVTGITLKKVGQLVALLLGLTFAALQGLAYLGFIDLKWAKIHQTIEKFCDLNKDGKVDENDLKFGSGKILGVLAEGVPSVGGFLAGFAMGVRMG